MNILAIGNSFSWNATKYLHQIAHADGERLKTVNLYYPACSLERHYRNMLANRREYILQYNGSNTGFMMSIEETLLSRQWDVITLQQTSLESYRQESFTPYIEELAKYVRKCQPKAKLLIHQTWAYEKNSRRLTEQAGFATPEAMLEKIRQAYDWAADAICADGMILSGELMQKLTEQGLTGLYADTFHASAGLGQYALGLLWYHVLTGRSAADNSFCDFHTPVTPEEMAAVKVCVNTFKPVL